MEERKWLPHLYRSVPKEAHGYLLSAYSIALEGWRRGMTLKFTNDKGMLLRNFTLSYKGKSHQFSASRSDIVPKNAVRICIDKYLTKEYLMESGVPTPIGKIFTNKSSDEEVIIYANDLGYPLVLKPSNASGGQGVIANIKNIKEFREALQHVRHTLKFDDVIVEEFVKGEDYRVYVIDGKVVGIIGRKTAHVIGDGKSRIRRLLDKKVKERGENPAIQNSPIVIDKELHDMLALSDYTLDSIPGKGEEIPLKSISNVSVGGDPVDATDILPNEIKEIAINAARAIPGLVQAGVDVMYNSVDNTGYVLEINSKPSIRTHLFPIEGKARDIPKAIIDYCFPESVSSEGTTASYYFGIQGIYKAFLHGEAKEFVVPDMPYGNISSFEWIISGSSRINTKKWVLGRVRRLGLHGYVSQLKSGETSVVISGKINAIKEFEEMVKKEVARKSLRMEVKEYTHPVKIGFEFKEFKKREKRKKTRPTQKEYNKLLLERDFYRKRFKNIENSKTWRITRPIRKLSYFAKNIFKSN